MKFEVLSRLFVESNPGGSIDFLGNGQYHVFYGKGKAYTYRSTSHYALAERFGLIPEPEPVTDAACRKLVARLRSGEVVRVVNGGFHDTIRCLWIDDSVEAIDCTLAGERDEFDRELWAMRLVTPDSDPAWWDYNVARWRR